MRIETTQLRGLMRILPETKGDERGFFLEVYRRDIFAQAGMSTDFVQENHSRSQRGVLRGLHFQYDPPLSKLIRVIAGEAFMALVDIRPNSPTLGRWHSEMLSAENKIQLYAPAGFATGFCVTGEFAEVEYHYSALYNQNGESNIRWNDPELAIPWPTTSPTLSPRDAQAQSLREWLARPDAQIFI